MPEQQLDQTQQISPVAASIGGIIYLALIILMIAATWRVFKKAGEPGWAAIVPIYNAIVFLRIAGKPGWWVILLCIPVVGIIPAIIALVSFVERFGKGVGYVIGMIFLSPVFMPMLAWGDAQYLGPKTDGPLGSPALS